MGIRNEWISEPSTPERLAEAMTRSIFAMVSYLAALVAVVVWAGAEMDWFAAFGLFVPLFWLLKWFIPNGDGEEC